MPRPDEQRNAAYTMALRLCDDGQRIDMPLLNRLRTLGGHKPYPEDADIQCTGSAHLAGEHILCTSPVHAIMPEYCRSSSERESFQERRRVIPGTQERTERGSECPEGCPAWPDCYGPGSCAHIPWPEDESNV